MSDRNGLAVVASHSGHHLGQVVGRLVDRRGDLVGLHFTGRVWDQEVGNHSGVFDGGGQVDRLHLPWRPLGKTVFITLEDETGHIPLVVWPKVYQRYQHELASPLVLATGTVSRREGTFNIVVAMARGLSWPNHELAAAIPVSRDFR